MPLPIPTSCHDIKPFHYHPHLLVQFTLSEMITAGKKMRSLENLMKQFDKSVQYDEFIQLVKEVTDLAGSAPTYAHFFTPPEEGILTKIKNFTNFFCHIDQSNKNYIDMHRAANAAVSHAFRSLELMQKLPRYCTSKDMKDVIQTIKKVKLSLNRVLRTLKRVIVELRTNENVLFFLLSNHQELNSLFKKSFVKQLLLDMFSQDFDEAKKYILSQYQTRGYVHLLPTIQSKLDAL